MSSETGTQTGRQRNFHAITTNTSILADPARFVKRYGTAIHVYLRALIPNEHDADEVEQDLLLQVVERGFPDGQGRRGKFRYYLMTVVRNAALAYFRKRSRRPMTMADFSSIPATEVAERAWDRTWRECVMKNAWLALRQHEQHNPGNLFHTVLRTSIKHSEEDSSMLAIRVSSATGQELSAEAFRKQLSRARRKFGELLIHEVARTMSHVTPESLEEELSSLDLLKYVRWHT
jgi:DNA-directed RNA polymerase specialized sigma24 family protein